ncbi:hypothetical protein GGR53DRAFT_231106 [Hypoxylon sp. FL1150]|nr:hypothetical protein GGR53DRAFT_231106 [Hypoxylon sp. FL1150]
MPMPMPTWHCQGTPAGPVIPYENHSYFVLSYSIQHILTTCAPRNPVVLLFRFLSLRLLRVYHFRILPHYYCHSFLFLVVLCTVGGFDSIIRTKNVIWVLLN